MKILTNRKYNKMVMELTPELKNKEDELNQKIQRYCELMNDKANWRTFYNQEYERMALENGKLDRENMELKRKYIELSNSIDIFKKGE